MRRITAAEAVVGTTYRSPQGEDVEFLGPSTVYPGALSLRNVRTGAVVPNVMPRYPLFVVDVAPVPATPPGVVAALASIDRPAPSSVASLLGQRREVVEPAIPGLSDDQLAELAGRDTRGWVLYAVEQERNARAARIVSCGPAPIEIPEAGGRSTAYMRGRGDFADGIDALGNPYDPVTSKYDFADWLRGWIDLRDLAASEPGFVREVPAETFVAPIASTTIPNAGAPIAGEPVATVAGIVIDDPRAEEVEQLAAAIREAPVAPPKAKRARKAKPGVYDADALVRAAADPTLAPPSATIAAEAIAPDETRARAIPDPDEGAAPASVTERADAPLPTGTPPDPAAMLVEPDSALVPSDYLHDTHEDTAAMHTSEDPDVTNSPANEVAGTGIAESTTTTESDVPPADAPSHGHDAAPLTPAQAHLVTLLTGGQRGALKALVGCYDVGVLAAAVARERAGSARRVVLTALESRLAQAQGGGKGARRDIGGTSRPGSEDRPARRTSAPTPRVGGWILHLGEEDAIATARTRTRTAEITDAIVVETIENGARQAVLGALLDRLGDVRMVAADGSPPLIEDDGRVTSTYAPPAMALGEAQRDRLRAQHARLAGVAVAVDTLAQVLPACLAAEAALDRLAESGVSYDLGVDLAPRKARA